MTGLNESVYTTTETTSWSEKLTDIEYTDTGLTDDIDKGYAYNGEASCLLNYAITSLDQIRGYAINVKFSEYKSTLGRITSYSKKF